MTTAPLADLTDAQLHHLRVQARVAGTALLDALAQAMDCHPYAAALGLAQRLDLETLTSDQLHTCTPCFERWPLAHAQAQGALLLHASLHAPPCTPPHAYWAAITDPLDLDLRVQLEHAAGAAVQYKLCTPQDLAAYLVVQEQSVKAVDSMVQTQASATVQHADVQVLSLASATESTSPAVQLVSSTLYDALRAAASDVHLESTPNGLCVRFRIDGVLEPIAQLVGRDMAEQSISRLKVLAELDIAERRVPQDGSFQVRTQERLIDLRVSIIPTLHGEDAVIRILDKQAMLESHGKLDLQALGFEGEAITTLRELSQAAYGMLLVTGPTGSGKTTTLYAALMETHNPGDKVITIEDPVEYQLPGVMQIPVNEKKGLTFSRGLRSILRHDPDKILVGEIRDRETAEIAVQSALTGHLVLTTLHANNVFDVFGRFTHMGLDPYTLVSALNGIWAQRLVRINCKRCSKPYTPTRAELAWAALDAPDPATTTTTTGPTFMKGAGCGDCRGSGYRGRKAIAEFLLLDDALREMIVQRQPVRQIKDAARQRGTRSLREVALDLVLKGLTTIEEVRRVTLAD